MLSLDKVLGVLTTPFSHIPVLCEMCVGILSDRIVLAIVFFLLGMATLLFVEAFFIMFQLRETQQPPPESQRSVIKLPEVLKNRLGMQSLTQKEDCVWLNFLTHFLFAELRDSIALRRFLTKKIQKEFEEVLTSRTGVFMDELFLRDYNLGDKCPVFMGVSVEKCDVKDDIIETLDIRARILYDGGFQICIDADLPFGRTANISVKLLKLKGFIRIRFTSIPFSYWSFSFYEEPEIELDVSAQLDGRPVTKLKNVISHQIRKIIRKKHMLPMYKIRYKPFFHPLSELLPSMPENLQISGIPIASGMLEVTLIGASKLPVVNKGAQLYCTLSADPLPWKQMMTQSRLKRPVLTKELVKNLPDHSLGLILKDDLVSDRLYPVVVVEQVLIGSPAHQADIKQGDILVTVNGSRVTSAKHATKFLKSNKDRLTVQVESKTEKTSSSARGSQSEDNLDIQPSKDLNSDDVDKQKEGEEPVSVSSAPIITDSHILNTRKTRLKPSVADPSWDQKFIFAVNPSMAYLNICVWSHGGDRSSRNDIIGSSSHDVLVGHVNLNLDDVYLHCLLTLSGKLHDKVKLKHGHHQTEAELAKEWSSHKGWNPEFMYGDLTLAFHFVPSLLTSKQRRGLTNAKSPQMEVISSKINSENKQGQDAKASPRKTAMASDSSAPLINDSGNLTQGHHQFDSTSFVTATFCDYCGKKIWMKEAFKCRTCNMVCHKKCLVKCLVNTLCTEEGAKKRTEMEEIWEPLTVSNRSKADPQDGNASDKEASRDTPVVGMDLSKQSESASLPSDEMKSPSRFRNLKDRTERIKENVVKSIRKTKTPSPLNDKVIMDAKEAGTQLYADLEPVQRREKLEEMIAQLDEQLKFEMRIKEELEQDLDNCTADFGMSPAKRKADAKTLETKISKSNDKLNGMRLLMLQYCTALQVCIKDAEGVDEYDKTELAGTSSDMPQASKVSYMGGFVKRASSSVKEKMSSIRKDFGKKGSPKSSRDTAASSGVEKLKQEEGKNNNRILTSIFEGFTSKTESKDSGTEPLLQDEELSENAIKIPEPTHTRSRSLIDDTLLRCGKEDSLSQPGSLPSTLILPQIRVDEDRKNVTDVLGDSFKDDNELKPLGHLGSQISRSSSDSHLEINKMFRLKPDEILRYHGNSLPKVLVSEDDNSESDDYFIMDSSDENEMSDFSEEDNPVRKNSSQNSMIGDDVSKIVVTPEDVIQGSIKYCKTADHDYADSDGKDENGKVDGTHDNNSEQDSQLNCSVNSYIV